MSPNSQDIASIIKRQIEDFGGDFTMVDIGTVVEAGDGEEIVQKKLTRTCYVSVIFGQ
jgi:hypothetical protein